MVWKDNRVFLLALVVAGLGIHKYLGVDAIDLGPGKTPDDDDRDIHKSLCAKIYNLVVPYECFRWFILVIWEEYWLSLYLVIIVSDLIRRWFKFKGETWKTAE